MKRHRRNKSKDVKIPQSKHKHEAPVLCIRTLRKTAGGGEGNTHTHTQADMKGLVLLGPPWRQQAGLQKVRHTVTPISLLAIIASYFPANHTLRMLRVNSFSWVTNLLDVWPSPSPASGCVWRWRMCSISPGKTNALYEVLWSNVLVFPWKKCVHKKIPFFKETAKLVHHKSKV